ncbi:AI-2E family transporter [Nocardioides sp. KR10-350]|uniref:AI-2E family transporter n=1 Tax=Nocardioides cheoyonin TaxID=3156615 RepID=UPI0032B4095B
MSEDAAGRAAAEPPEEEPREDHGADDESRADDERVTGEPVDETDTAGAAGADGRDGRRTAGRPRRDPARAAAGESLAVRLFQQWNQLREERQEQLASPVPLSTSQPRRSTIPYGVDLAASWAWRFLVIVAAGYVLVRALGYLELIVVPVVVALLIAALVVPIVDALQRIGVRRSISALIVVIGVIAVVGAMLTFAGQQVASGASDLAQQASQGLGEIRDWLKTGPLHASENQIDDWINRAQQSLADWGSEQGKNPVSKVTEVGGVAADVLAGMFIVLFSTYFFLAEGAEIWSWVVRLTPRVARDRVDSSGRVAWISLTQFTRATVIVAAVDSVGIMIVAAVLGVPFVAAIGVLVFLGAFVPLIGATIAGTVAVLVALVDQGLVTALIMLGGVILVQQLEAHGLQPFLMGRWVRVHPLAVILAIATGVLVAGVAGALVAVPLAAALNAVVQHLAAEDELREEEAEQVTEEGLESG